MTEDVDMTRPLFLENINAPELFASLATNFAIHDNVVTIILASRRWDHSTDPGIACETVVARLVMPVSGAQGMVLGLHRFLETHGVGLVSPAERERPV